MYTVLATCWVQLPTRYSLMCSQRGGGGDSSVGTATSCSLDGPGIESRCGRDFCTLPDRTWVTPRLPHNGYRVFPGVKRQGRVVDHSPPSRQAQKLISGPCLCAKVSVLE